MMSSLGAHGSMLAVLLPEPLQAFESLDASIGEVLQSLDARVLRYRDAHRAGRVLANTIEALRIELTYNSNAIEGNTLSLRETQLVIEGRTPPAEKTLREVYEARNHDRALRHMEAWIPQRRDQPIAEQDLLDLHSMVLQDIDLSAAGHYRVDRVRIAGTGFIPPANHHFAQLIPLAFERANAAGLHPVLRAAEFHYNLVAIHPFSDGNGRAARLMMNYLLMRNDYPPALVKVENRSRYLAALDAANKGRVEPFARFIIESIGEALDQMLL